MPLWPSTMTKSLRLPPHQMIGSRLPKGLIDAGTTGTVQLMQHTCIAIPSHGDLGPQTVNAELFTRDLFGDCNKTAKLKFRQIKITSSEYQSVNFAFIAILKSPFTPTSSGCKLPAHPPGTNTVQLKASLWLS